MADETKVYALDDGANKHETMTKEQVLAAIVQAVENGTITNIDTGFITKLQETNKKTNLKVWVGTNAEFTALQTKDADTLYLFTDDPTIDDMEQAVTEVEEAQSDLQSGLMTGRIQPQVAVNAKRAIQAGYSETNGSLKAGKPYQQTSSVTVTLTAEDIQSVAISHLDGSVRARLILDLSLLNLKKKYPSDTTFAEVDQEIFPERIYRIEIPMWLTWTPSGMEDAQLSLNSEDLSFTKSFIYDDYTDPNLSTENVIIYRQCFNLTFYFTSKDTNTFTLKWDTTGYTDNQTYNPVNTGFIRGYSKGSSSTTATMQLITGATWRVDAYRLEIDKQF